MITIYKFLIFIICLLNFLDVLAQGNDYEYKTETISDFSFKDAHAFKSADSMYLVADTLPYSSLVSIKLKALKQSIKNSKFLEKDEVWNELIGLEPYRMNPAMAVEVNSLSKLLAGLIEKSEFRFFKSISLNDSKKFSSLYKSGDFEAFIKEGRELLLKFPRNSDIRNNVALALMHTNRDLCAWVELETIRRIDSLHKPALINLTVVYERLGKRKDAEKLANQLLTFSTKAGIKSPQIIYNAAWYLNLQESYLQVDSLLSGISSLNLTKHNNIQSLKELRHKEILENLRKRPFFEAGIMGRFGFQIINDFYSWYFIIATIFVVAISILFLVLYDKKRESRKKGSGFNFFVQLLILSFIMAIAYLMAWGFPTSEIWYYFAGYSLLPFLIIIALLLVYVIFSIK